MEWIGIEVDQPKEMTWVRLAIGYPEGCDEELLKHIQTKYGMKIKDGVWLVDYGLGGCHLLDTQSQSVVAWYEETEFKR